jgi:hypothetical protein
MATEHDAGDQADQRPRPEPGSSAASRPPDGPHRLLPHLGWPRTGRRSGRRRARRARVLIQLVTWLTVLTLLPVPWGAVADWLPDAWLSWESLRFAWAEENGIPPSQRRGIGGQSAPASAFPPENVVLQRAGSSLVTPLQVRKPTFDFDESPGRGPGLAARHELPAEPLQSVDLRLRGVGGRQPQKSGRQTRFQVPRDGSGALPLVAPPSPQPNLPRVGSTPQSPPPTAGTPPIPTSTVTATPVVPSRTPTVAGSPAAQAAPTGDGGG